jgi:pyruvate formate lyase activating enzyme
MAEMLKKGNSLTLTATVFNIERHALHDGPGIRTLVFVKGCPLHCLWCSNPEGQDTEPELLFRAKDCISCMRCVKACPQGAVKVSDDRVMFAQDRIVYTDRELCNTCGDCVAVCPAGAREIAGRKMSVEQVVVEVLKDEIFYRNSGGGVTLSGGSPLIYPDFVGELFRELKGHAVHTAVETCGAVDWSSFEKVIDYTDLFLYDLKHMNSEMHERHTGMGNTRILENLHKLDERGAHTIVRVPVIPHFNDNREEIEAIARFTMELSSKPPMQLLPYHTLGRSKYHHLEREYPLERQGLLLVSVLEDLERAARAINPRTSLEV